MQQSGPPHWPPGPHPPSGFTIPLRTDAGRVASVLLALASLAIVGLGALWILGVSINDQMSGRDKALELLAAIPLLILGTWLVFLGTRMALPGTPTLKLEADHLVIHHRALFRRAIEIPRSAVRAVDVDVGTEGRFRQRERFAVARTGDEHREVPAWLYSRAHGSPLPIIGHHRQIPNIAVILDEPVRFRGILRVSRPVFRHTVRSPIRTKDVRGFLVAARHPFVAEQQFRAWGAHIRSVTAAETATLLPSAEDHRRQRIRTIATVAIGTIVFGGQAAVAFWLLDPVPQQTCEGMRSSTAVRFSGGEDRVEEVADLSSVVPTEAEPGWLPDESGEAFTSSGVETWVGEGWAPALADRGFEQGYTRSWSSGDAALFQHVLEFPTPRQAVSMHDAFLADACPRAEDAFRVPGVRGATAVEIEQDGTVFEVSHFTRGSRLYVVSLEGPDGGDEGELIEWTRRLDAVAR